MSKAVRLASRLPKDDEVQGLDHFAQSLIDDDEQTLCVVAWIEVDQVVKHRKTGARVPLVYISRIEPIGRAENVPEEITEIVFQAFYQRTGREALPFDRTEVVEGKADPAPEAPKRRRRARRGADQEGGE